MCHVDHQHGTDLVGDLTESGEVQLPGVCRPARDDHLGLVIAGCLSDGIHVNEVVVFGHLIGRDVVELAGEIDPHPVGEVAPVSQREPENGVSGIEQRVHGGRIGSRTRMWLHVGVFGAEERFDAVDGQLLHAVDEFAAAVVAPARVALGVLVGQDRALGLHHRQRCVVLRGDHFQPGFLAVELAVDQGRDVGVEGA
ncbi:Serine hydroxymethyltransferase [Mycobacterium marinum MB2]|nr:Serine hydroxymethyltransferase [Mycobacterium marinum MB2]